MPTEIGQVKGVQIPATQDRERVSRSPGQPMATSASGTPQGTSDEVSLSSGALTLLEVGQRLGTQPDLDQQRVQAIREALEQGRYRIDAPRLAEALLAQERLFLAGYAP